MQAATPLPVMGADGRAVFGPYIQIALHKLLVHYFRTILCARERYSSLEIGFVTALGSESRGNLKKDILLPYLEVT